MSVRILRATGICTVCAVTVAACTSKLVKLDGFISALDAAKIVPSASIRPTASIVILYEVALLLGLIIPRTRTASLFGGAVFYAGACAYSLLRALNGSNAECGCFPGILQLGPVQSIGLSLTLFAICLGCAVVPAATPSPLNNASAKSIFALLSLACLAVIGASLVHIMSADLTIGVAVPGVTELGPNESTALANAQRAQSLTTPILFNYTDLQCPGCKIVKKDLDVLEKLIPRLTIETHHLPLTQIHPAAYELAVLARGCEEAHRKRDLQYLFDSESPTNDHLNQIASDLGQKALTAAKDSVDRDLATAQAVGFNSTPSLVLRMGNHFFQVRDISNVSKTVAALLTANSSLRDHS